MSCQKYLLGAVMKKEEEWVESIQKLLKRELTHRPSLSSGFKISTQRGLPYAWEILAYLETDKGFSPAKGYEKGLFYKTDLLIYEEAQNQIKPRIIIEAKYANNNKEITTHDAITYSNKAAQHKAITPYLRYGIMLGQHNSLPGRLFRHGVNFDFMISFEGEEPTSKEKASLVELINSEWNFSKQIEEMLSENRSRNRKRYFMLQNALQLKKI